MNRQFHLIFVSPNCLKPFPQSPRQRREINFFLSLGVLPVLIETHWIETFDIRKLIRIERNEVTFNNLTFPLFTLYLYILRVHSAEPLYKLRNKLNFVISSAIYILRLSLLIIQLMRKYRTNIVLASNAPDFTGIACFIVKSITLFRLKYIFEFRELTPELYSIRSGNTSLYYLLSIIERLVVRSCDLAVVVSKTMQVVLQRKHRIPGDKFIVVYSSPDRTEFHELKKFELQLNKDNSKVMKILYGGNYLKDIHDIETLILAINMLVHNLSIKNIQVLIVGKSDLDYLQYLHSLVSDLNLSSYVKFLKWLDRNEYLKVLLQSDLCVIPMKKNVLTAVSSPNKMLEYLFMGKIILAPNLPAIREIIIHDVNGLLYRPEDPENLAFLLYDYILNPNKLSNLRRNLKKYLHNHAHRLLFDIRFLLVLERFIKRI